MRKSIQQQRGNARSKTPERRQIEMQLLSLDQWLDKDHRVRNVWAYVESLDLSELYEPIKATRDNVGRDPIDPRILFALWLFATIEGTTSARRIAPEVLRREREPRPIGSYRSSWLVKRCVRRRRGAVPENPGLAKSRVFSKSQRVRERSLHNGSR